MKGKKKYHKLIIPVDELNSDFNIGLYSFKLVKLMRYE